MDEYEREVETVEDRMVREFMPYVKGVSEENFRKFYRYTNDTVKMGHTLRQKLFSMREILVDAGVSIPFKLYRKDN